MRAVFLVVGACWLGACTPALDLGYAVAVTAKFDDSVSDAALARVVELSFVASGGETSTSNVTLGRPAMRTERTVYRPLASDSGHMIVLDVVARDASGLVVAEGRASIDLAAGKTEQVTIELSVDDSDAGIPDGGEGPGNPDFGPPENVSFRTAQRVPTAAGPCAVAAGPLDGDERDDVVVATCASGKVQGFFTNADGSLPDVPSFQSTVAADPSAVAIANVTGDASDDVVIADHTSGVVSALPGDGQGGFGAPIALFTRSAIDALATADLDHDGVMDVVGASSTQAGLTLKCSTSTGPLTLSSGAVEARVLTTDVNNDGWADLVGLTPTGTFVVQLNAGASAPCTFGAPLSKVYAAGVDVAAGSFNADAYPDFFVLQQLAASGSDSYVIPSGGAGTGDFTTQSNTELVAGTGTVGGSRVLIADLDGNGKPELLASYCPSASNGTPNGVRVHWNMTPGTALPTALLPSTLYATESCPTAMTAAHLVDAQHTDVVVVNSTSSSLSVLHADASATVVAAPTFLGVTSGMRMLDFNADGKLDLVYGDTGGVELAAGDGTGHFTASMFATETPIAGSALGDLNKDGLADLVFATTGANWYVALGKTGGGFQAAALPLNVNANRTLADIAIADVTGDGNLDVILVDSSSYGTTTQSNLVVNAGKGNGLFYEPNLYSAPAAQRLAIGRVNDDALDDVLVVSTGGLGVFLQRATAGLLALPSTPVANIGGVALVDADLDGHLDAVVAGDALSLLKGVGDGTFAPASTLLAAPFHDVVVADLDHDGVLDLAALSDTAVAVGNGNGTSFFFGLPAGYTFAAGAENQRVLAGDVTGDGLPDLVVRGIAATLLVNTTTPR